MTTLEEKSKGLLEIGSHCYHCNRIDFLPFNCIYCGHNYCSNHSKPELHDCTENERPINRDSREGTPTAAKGSSLGGHRLGGSAAKSPRTSSGPAISERPSPVPAASKSDASAAAKSKTIDKLKAFWAAKKSRNTGSALKSKAHIMELNTLKRTAKGDDKVPLQKRVYFFVQRPESKYTDMVTNIGQTRLSKKVSVFFQDDVVLGKVLDKSCQLLDMSNKTKNGGRLGLYLGGVALDPSAKLASVVQNGQTLEVK